jgi:hypothetical protein
MRWVLRLIATEDDARCLSTDLVEICRPEGLGDIANLGLTLPEAKQLLASVQRAVVSRRVDSHGQLRPCCPACSGGCHLKDWRGHRIATLFGEVTVRLPRFRCTLQSHRDERRLAIAMPIDARAGPTAGSSFRLDDLSRRRWRVPISCSRSAARSTMERSAWVRTSLSTTRQPERAVGQPGIIPHSLDTPGRCPTDATYAQRLGRRAQVTEFGRQTINRLSLGISVTPAAGSPSYIGQLLTSFPIAPPMRRPN